MSRLIPLTAAAVLFAPNHILLSYQNAKLGGVYANDRQ